jgi:hypothetical protein
MRVTMLCDSPSAVVNTRLGSRSARAIAGISSRSTKSVLNRRPSIAAPSIVDGRAL